MKHGILLLQCQMLALASKEYEAPWLSNTKTVTRDGTGRFTSKSNTGDASKEKQPTDKGSGQSQVTVEFTTETIAELLKDKQFRQLALLEPGMEMADMIKNFADAVKADPKKEKDIDELLSSLQKQVNKSYANGNAAVEKALQEIEEIQPPAKATYAEKLEFRVAKYALLEQMFTGPEDFAKALGTK